MPIISLPIAEVTVYSDRAMVTRRGAVATTGGTQELVLTDIPWSLDVDSVRVVDKTLIGGNRRTAFSYRILVGNNRPLPARLTLRDQVPVSRHQGLKIRLTRALPQPDEHTDHGELRWELTIPPGETREVGFDMTVEHPAAQTVVGL